MSKKTVVNLNSGKQGVWFPFFYSELDVDTMDIKYGDPIENGPRAKIRNPTPFIQERAETRETVSEMIFNKKARKMEKVTSEKELTSQERKAENEAMIDYMIQDVEGFKLDGKVIRNTKADKIEAMRIPLFSMFVNKCVSDLQKQSAEEEKEEQKNS